MRNESNLVGYYCRATHDESIHNLQYEYVGARLGCNMWARPTWLYKQLGFHFSLFMGYLKVYNVGNLSHVCGASKNLMLLLIIVKFKILTQSNYDH